MSISKILIGLILCLFVKNSTAQKLTVSDLTRVIAMPLTKAKEFVESKNYKYDKVDKTKYITSYRFSYKRSGTDINLAERFLFFKVSNIGADNEVEYQITDTKDYQAIQSFLKANGYKIDETYTNEEEQLCNQYSNSKYLFFICSGIDSETSNSVYNIRLVYKP